MTVRSKWRSSSSRLKDEFNSLADSSRACKPDRLKLELVTRAVAVFETLSGTDD